MGAALSNHRNSAAENSRRLISYQHAHSLPPWLLWMSKDHFHNKIKELFLVKKEPTSHSVAAQGSPSLMLQRFHSCTDSITPLHSLALARLRALSHLAPGMLSVEQYFSWHPRTNGGTLYECAQLVQCGPEARLAARRQS